MSLSRNLKRLRKENNLSQEQLADKLGVSRQAVSKWESDLAYPEMEKMLTLCKMFNLNIDELLNQDILEVNEVKDEKNNINKYIDDVLGFITKSIDMFSSMSFKTKVKCLIEEFIIFWIIFFIVLIIGAIGGAFVQDILMIFPDRVYFILYTIMEDIYIILGIILGSVLMLHIFKVRYLDYYVIDRVVDINEEVEVKDDINKKIYIEKKQERVIIRDPENAGVKFISLLCRGVLFGIKFFTVMFGSVFGITLVILVSLFILSFMFVKTGLVFFGMLLGIISGIIINLVILNILYNFVISKRIKFSRLGIYFSISLMMLGGGVGLFIWGITYFDIEVGKYYYEDDITLEWNDDLVIHGANVNYIESNNTDVKIVVKYSKYCDVDIDNYDNNTFISIIPRYDNMMEVVRDYIDSINNKKIVDYGYIEVLVYTSRDNINKLIDNHDSY